MYLVDFISRVEEKKKVKLSLLIVLIPLFDWINPTVRFSLVVLVMGFDWNEEICCFYSKLDDLMLNVCTDDKCEMMTYIPFSIWSRVLVRLFDVVHKPAMSY